MTTRITYWKEADGRYLGYLNAYPEHWTQGDDLADLKEQLRDLYQTFGTEDIPGIRKEEEPLRRLSRIWPQAAANGPNPEVQQIDAATCSDGDDPCFLSAAFPPTAHGARHVDERRRAYPSSSAVYLVPLRSAVADV